MKSLFVVFFFTAAISTGDGTCPNKDFEKRHVCKKDVPCKTTADAQNFLKSINSFDNKIIQDGREAQTAFVIMGMTKEQFMDLTWHVDEKGLCYHAEKVEILQCTLKSERSKNGEWSCQQSKVTMNEVIPSITNPADIVTGLSKKVCEKPNEDFVRKHVCNNVVPCDTIQDRKNFAKSLEKEGLIEETGLSKKTVFVINSQNLGTWYEVSKDVWNEKTKTIEEKKEFCKHANTVPVYQCSKSGEEWTCPQPKNDDNITPEELTEINQMVTGSYCQTLHYLADGVMKWEFTECIWPKESKKKSGKPKINCPNDIFFKRHVCWKESEWDYGDCENPNDFEQYMMKMYGKDHQNKKFIKKSVLNSHLEGRNILKKNFMLVHKILRTTDLLTCMNTVKVDVQECTWEIGIDKNTKRDHTPECPEEEYKKNCATYHDPKSTRAGHMFSELTRCENKQQELIHLKMNPTVTQL